MIKNIIKTAWRNIRKHKTFSAITILGLTTGFSCCMLIYLFVQHEFSYDKFNAKADRIYRLTSEAENTSGKTALAVSPAPWAPMMKKDFPEIENYVRLLKDEKSTLGQTGREQFHESGLMFADSSFFKIFSYTIIRGDVRHPLSSPNSIVLTQEAATKYFGNEDPIGKALDASAFGRNVKAQVTAVVKNNSSASHFQFSAILSMQAIGKIDSMWAFHMFQSYVLLKPGASRHNLESKFDGFVKHYIIGNPKADGKQDIHLQPLTDIHLRSNMIGEIGVNGDITYVYVFTGVGLFILLIACFNYTNLSTARSMTRAKEVGVRKVVGAERAQIIAQFIGETLFFALISLALAILLTRSMLPVFNQLSERTLSFNLAGNTSLLLIFAGLVLIVGALAGIYPALMLSAYKPVEVLKGKFHQGLKGATFRKFLVTIQFVIAIGLIASTVVISNQLHFLKSKDVGFNKSNVMIVALPGRPDSATTETFKTSLLGDSKIISIAAASTVPGTRIPVNQVNDGGADLSKAHSMQMLFTDLDFIKTMKMKVVAGRDFSKDYSTDKAEGFIVNQAALNQFGWKDAHRVIGHPVQWVLPNTVLKRGTIIGVVQNFNITPLRTEIQPLIMHYKANGFRYVFIRFNQAAVSQVASKVQQQFKALFPKQSFEYTMLDDTLNNMYTSEQKLGQMFSYFSFLAILIACIGILGLSLNSIQQRFKEIGIRRVLGSSIYGIAAGLVKEFLIPVFMAALIATPIAWLLMDKWLRGFAYRVPISIWLFVITTLAVLSLSILTMGYQSIKAALMNPVKSLKTE